MTTFKKIIWAIDPFEENAAARKNTLATVKGFTALPGTVIEPVYVLGPWDMSYAIGVNTDWSPRHLNAANRALNSALKATKLQKLRNSRVLIEKTGSTRQAVDMLLRHAKSRGADLIVAGTHGRKGLSRLLLGSFAETLLLRSRIPVLIVGPKAKPDFRSDLIVFPTDFSRASRKSLKNVLGLARQAGAGLMLYHKFQPVIPPLTYAGVALATDYDEALKACKKEAEKLAHLARSAGVLTEVYVDTRPGNIADGIVSFARRNKADLIAMTSQVGTATANLLGSVTRQTVRKSNCPVWAVHTA